ncbi:MAG: hypothetical protein ACRCS9_08750 [Hyphomicrobium sp.]
MAQRLRQVVQPVRLGNAFDAMVETALRFDGLARAAHGGLVRNAGGRGQCFERIRIAIRRLAQIAALGRGARRRLQRVGGFAFRQAKRARCSAHADIEPEAEHARQQHRFQRHVGAVRQAGLLAPRLNTWLLRAFDCHVGGADLGGVPQHGFGARRHLRGRSAEDVDERLRWICHLSGKPASQRSGVKRHLADKRQRRPRRVRRTLDRRQRRVFTPVHFVEHGREIAARRFDDVALADVLRRKRFDTLIKFAPRIEARPPARVAPRRQPVWIFKRDAGRVFHAIDMRVVGRLGRARVLQHTGLKLRILKSSRKHVTKRRRVALRECLRAEARAFVKHHCPPR